MPGFTRVTCRKKQLQADRSHISQGDTTFLEIIKVQSPLDWIITYAYRAITEPSSILFRNPPSHITIWRIKKKQYFALKQENKKPSLKTLYLIVQYSFTCHLLEPYQTGTRNVSQAQKKLLRNIVHATGYNKRFIQRFLNIYPRRAAEAQTIFLFYFFSFLLQRKLKCFNIGVGSITQPTWIHQK